MHASIRTLTALALLPGAGSLFAQDTNPMSITDVPGIRVGHHTLALRPTGCTVVLAPAGAVAGVDVRGGAPGTRETALLDPVNTVSRVHAVVLSGGSAFGLDAATGVTRWLEEQGIGYAAGGYRVPIVVAAILFDLNVGDGTIRPGAECGYEAARSALSSAPPEGSVGAGAGATVGKLRGMKRAMKGGIGSSSVRGPDGFVVGALIAVNALGDIIDPATGEVVAGVRTEDGEALADARRVLRDDLEHGGAGGPGNTVIGVVATNAPLTQSEATRVARMAHDGLARAVWPAHTPWDGDVLFVLSTGEPGGSRDPTAGPRADLTAVGALAADMVAEAILRAVRAAEGLPGLPTAGDLDGSR
ncbi:MAG: P1 family peptidase [Gemmatimonadota bacterium]|jgi:L-aminopeptidase/D-esterase-like protein